MRTAQAQSRAEGKQRDSGGGESTLTVVVALAANASIAVMKAVAGLLTGSAAMLAEAAHSVADTTTEGLLLAALRQSERPADRQHPFGYGKVRFFWSLIAAVSIFVTGALFSGFEGVRTILGSGEDQTLAWVAFLVLGLSFLMEGASWIKAVRQIRREQSNEGQQLLEYRPTIHRQDGVPRGHRGADRPAPRLWRGRVATAHRLSVVGWAGIAADRGAAGDGGLPAGPHEHAATDRPAG
jgi:Co/Zn/Cd efflux system component